MMLADDRMWHEAADPGCPLSGRYRAISGQHMLNTSSSEIDPGCVKTSWML
jgi:hypothetical protein